MIRICANADLAMKGLGSILSYSSPFYVRKDIPVASYIVPFAGSLFIISSPFRIGHKTWRSIPLLTDASAKHLFGNMLDGLPLQIACHPVLDADSPSMAAQAGRGNDYDPEESPDSVMITAQGADENFSIHTFMSGFWLPFLESLRVRSGQWWIGRNSEGFTSNVHFCLETGPECPEGRLLSPRCSQIASGPSVRLIDDEIWKSALDDAAQERVLNQVEIIKLDIEFYFSVGEYLTCILLLCGWIENLRDLTLSKHGKKINNLKVGPYDLIKHVSDGFGILFGRNLKIDNLDAFEFVKASWISRGNFAHGKRMAWHFKTISNLAAMPRHEFFNMMNVIEEWFGAI